MKNKIFPFVLILILILLVGCASKTGVTAPSQEPGEPQQEPVDVAQDEPTEPTTTIEECAASLEELVKQAYDNYEITISDDKTSLLLYLWQDGLATECYKASKGIEPYASEWKNIVNSMKDLSVNVQGFVDEAGHEEVSAAVVVKNDANLDAVLLMTNKGRVVLDAAGS